MADPISINYSVSYLKLKVSSSAIHNYHQGQKCCLLAHYTKVGLFLGDFSLLLISMLNQAVHL